MGVLSQTMAGAAAGLGQGITAYGQGLQKESLEADRQRFREQLQQDRLDNAVKLAEMRGEQRAGGGGTGGGRSGAAADPSAPLRNMYELLLGPAGRGVLAMGGMTSERAADAQAMIRGETPTDVTQVNPAGRRPDRLDDMTASGQGRQIQTPRYTPGDGARLMEEARVKFRRAVGLTNLAAADDIAKAENTEQVGVLVGQYAQGDAQAGRAALIGQGKGVFGAAGDEVTGAAPAGSVAGSTVTKNNAEARESDAKGREADANAGKHRAEVEKIAAELSGDLKKQSPEKLHNMLNAITNVTKDGTAQDDEALMKQANALRMRLLEEMSSRLSPQAATTVPPPAPAADPGSTKPSTAAPAASSPGGRVSSATQAQRDSDSAYVLAQEYGKAKTASDREAIQREVSRMPKAAQERFRSLTSGGASTFAPAPGMPKQPAPAASGTLPPLQSFKR
jgi:hypothetical protein